MVGVDVRVGVEVDVGVTVSVGVGVLVGVIDGQIQSDLLRHSLLRQRPIEKPALPSQTSGDIQNGPIPSSQDWLQPLSGRVGVGVLVGVGEGHSQFGPVLLI
jgi:hypothetical protein